MTDAPAITSQGRRARPRVTLHGLRRGATRVRLSLAVGLRLREPVVVVLIATVVLSAYFVALPGVDMAVSALFHSEGGFTLSGDPALKALRKSSSWTMGVMLLGLMATIAGGLIRSPRHLTIPVRRALVLIAGLVLASGLLVNGVLKSMWGRARPIQIEAFGGDADFSRAWSVSDQCLSNCSFVSGEGSSAAWMVAVVAVMTPPQWRRWTLPAAVAYGAALSINRIAFGGHFLSDILLSWALTGLVLAALCRLALSCPRKARETRRARRFAAA
ncbi:MAG: phosphatase PAP2 family protein [Alphaproteobacteria bacterium]|nr:phosphatase PAP2 family protein [Alphaproteobacteria bacterium]MBU2378497.1 phosphatase PAP2 family protein [Alphaproteobacteria bacterium]